MEKSQDTSTSKFSNGARNYLTIPSVPDSIWKNPLHFIAFGFGAGAIRFAPGTFGTLAGIPFYLILANYSLVTYSVITLIAIFASIKICDIASHDIGIEDHQGMCLDEVIGFLVAMIGAPFGWPWILLGFLLFRFFDIVKPWPISYIDAKWKGGFGMIADDVLAGIASALVLQVIAYLYIVK